MRSLLLASAAIMLSTGIACAQTTSSAPMAAPAGSSNEPTAQSGTPAGKASSNGDAQGSMSNGSMSNSNAMSSTAPSYNGQNAVTNGQSKSTETGPLGQHMASTNAGSMGYGSHHWAYGAMPENADARTYLRIARMDIQHHNRAGADDALSRAETRVLTRSVPADGSMTDDSPMVTAIENARQAVDAGNFHEAAMDTDMAMHHHMSGGGDMGSDVSAGSSDMGGTPSPHAQQNGNKPNAAAASGQQQ